MPSGSGPSWRAAPAVWLGAVRPKTLTVAVSPVIVGCAMAYEAGAWHAAAAGCALVCALLIQIGTNLWNDYKDVASGADTEDRKGPRRAAQAGLVSPGALKAATIGVFATAFLCGLYLVARAGWPILVVGLLAIASGVLYSTSRFSLARTGLADLFVLVFFGPVAVGGTYYVQALALEPIVLLVGLAPGLLAVAILLVNNIRDMAEDGKAGKRTLVVRFGKKFGIGAWVFCVVIAALIPLDIVLFSNARAWAGLPVVIVLPALSIFHRMCAATDPVALNPLLGATSLLLIIHSVLFSIGWII